MYHEFGQILNTLETNNNEVIITGDFNVDLLKINDKNVFSEYFDMLIDQAFILKLHFRLDYQISMEH